MPGKKRKVPEAVQAHRERKVRQAASMAQRQGAALDKSARERLKALVNATTIEFSPLPPPASLSVSRELEKQIDSAFANAMAYAASRGARHWLINASEVRWTGLPEPIPTIDPKRLEVLKKAEPYKPPMRVPDMVQVITGWRGWRLKDGLLAGLGVKEVWPARKALRAVCKNGEGENHLAPYWDCQCGIWAFKDIDRLVAAIGYKYADVKVIGSVSLWGRVIETENGYRAQYGYPSELWLLNESIEELGLIYDVPVRR